MNRYTVLELIGEGTFGTVSRAVDSQGRQYAIKSFKSEFTDWDAIRQNREFQAVLALSQTCPALVRVHEILREEDSKLHFVCEFMPNGDLKDFIRRTSSNGQTLAPTKIRSILFQVLQGLDHIHKQGFMHRDLKPENILIAGTTFKVADFSLARLSTLQSGDNNAMTSYVSSRWYRAPEILLASNEYGSAIDLFALGCVMAELYSLTPLFPGKDEHGQLPLVLELLGPIRRHVWPRGAQLLETLPLNVPRFEKTLESRPVAQRLGDKLKIIDRAAAVLMSRMLELNPMGRPTAKEAMDDPFFQEPFQLGHSLQTPCSAQTTQSFSQEVPLGVATQVTPVKAMDVDEPLQHSFPVVTISPKRAADSWDYPFEDWENVFEVVQSGNPAPAAKRQRVSSRPSAAFGIDY